MKKYKRSITVTCMVYQNHTARQIPKERYQVPFIGKEAIKVQLQQAREEVKKLNDNILLFSERIKIAAPIFQTMPNKQDRYAYWKSLWKDVSKQEQVEEEFYSKQQELWHLDKSEVDNLEREQVQWKEKRDKNDERGKNNQLYIGKCEKNIELLTREILEMQKIVNEKLEDYQIYRKSLPDELTKACDEKWTEEVKDKSEKDISSNYVASTEGLKTKKHNLFTDFVQLRTEHNTDFEFGADPKKHDNEQYQKRLVFLRESSLIEYKDKAKKARRKANETFQEHFISKLKENIERAKSNFKILDHAMKDMQFGTDRYRFRVNGKSDMLQYYRMITDPDLDLGHSLFSNHFVDRHGDVIEDLFTKIAEEQNDFSDQLDFYTDYRNYLDFELEIIDENGEESKFSKVALEKSGGETQVPFYVAILASFYHTYELYRTNDTLRLVIFDEAFNRMDADRVEEAVQFILKMGFQPIIVAPTGKIQLLAPHLQNTHIVMKEGFVSYVEGFSRNDIAKWVEEGVTND